MSQRTLSIINLGVLLEGILTDECSMLDDDCAEAWATILATEMYKRGYRVTMDPSKLCSKCKGDL